MRRDELTEALERFLARAFVNGDVDTCVLEPVGLEMGSLLAAAIEPADTHAWYLIGWLHFARYRVLPDGEDQVELHAAIAAFTHVASVDVTLVPDPLRPMVAQSKSAVIAKDGPAGWADEGVDIMRDWRRSADPATLDRAVSLLSDAVAATPAGHPDRAMYLSTLGVALRSRFERTRLQTDLDRALQLGLEAVQAAQLADLDRPAYLSGLGGTLLTRFVHCGDLSNLDDAVWAQQEAVNETPADHPDRYGYLSNLGTALELRFMHTGNIADLDRAILAGREALRTTHHGHPNRAGVLNNLGSALLSRFKRTAAPTDLEQAIQAARDAVAEIPIGHPDRPGILANFGKALHNRFMRTGNIADAEQAIQAGQEAVAATPDGHPYRAVMLNNLGSALLSRYERTGGLADLDESIRVARAAVVAAPAGHPERAGYLHNLGGALLTRFERQGLLADLDEAVQVGQTAVAATPPHHPHRVMFLSGLCNALGMRFRRTGTLPDLNHAIEAGRDAVTNTPAGHPDLAGYLSNLSSMLEARFSRAGALADLDQAIEAGQEALTVVPADHPDRIGYLSNLGNALQSRFTRTGLPSDLDLAIQAARDAVAASPADHPGRIKYLSNLGLALMARFVRTKDPADLDLAIQAGQDALTGTPADHPARTSYLSNLGLKLRARSESTESSADLDEAIRLGQEAATATPVDHPHRATHLCNFAAALHARFKRTGSKPDLDAAFGAVRDGATASAASPSARVTGCRWWLDWAASSADWAQAREATQVVLSLLPQLADHGLGVDDRRSLLGEPLQGLGALAAWAALEGGASTGQTAVQHAWSVLEAARGIMLGQALETRDDLTELTKHHPELAGKVVVLRTNLNRDQPPDPDGTALDAGATRAAAAQEWVRLMTQIRTLPGFDRFGLPPTVDQMQTAAGEGTLVAILVTEHGCGALLLDAHTTDYVRLPALTHTDLMKHAIQILAAAQLGSDRDLLINDDTDITARTQMQQTLGWLWDVVAEPVLDHLNHTKVLTDNETGPRVWWMPTGLASMLPIHAAGHHHLRGRSVMDRAISSYTPTVRALWHSRQYTTPPTIGDALVVGIDDAPGLSPLLFAEAEARQVHLTLACAGPPLLGDAAVHSVVTKKLPSAAWAHFACHGFTHHTRPGDSFLALHDRPLRIRELAELDLTGGHLATLSACTTATTALDAVDEPIHLASAFQIAGYTHTIATLWSISDPIAPVFTNNIYRHLKAGASPAEALHHATRAMRANPRTHNTPQLWASHIHLGP